MHQSHRGRIAAFGLSETRPERLAAQAMDLGLVLVTHNGREFERIPGLQVDDWLD